MGKVKQTNRRKKQAKLIRQIGMRFYTLDQCCEKLIPDDGDLQGKVRDVFRGLCRDFGDLSRLYDGNRLPRI